MNDTSNNSSNKLVNKKIEQLRKLFVQQLPQRIQNAEKLFVQLQSQLDNSELIADLHRVLHSIKGTGKSFGFDALGSVAAVGEAILINHIDNNDTPLPPNWQKSISNCILELQQEQIKLQKDTVHIENNINVPITSYKKRKSRKGRLVYICDDEEILLDKLKHQLTCFGYKTECFTDTKSFYEQATKKLPDAVIMDINFPLGRNAGIEILMNLDLESRMQLPTIFMSARDDFNARLGAVRAGGDAYFVKPVRSTEIVAALDDLTWQQETEPYRVLIIDDEAEMADYHAILLKEAGFVTRTLNSPAEVLKVLADFHPDIILMDMYMPGCNGRDVAKVIRQIPDYVGLPIVYLSSETDRKKQFNALSVGAEAFLTKPVIPEELVSSVLVRAERMRTLRSLMSRDSLTGLFNHSTTTQLLDSAVQHAKRKNGTLCFVMLDIDSFKAINDTYGHQSGDRVIVSLSRFFTQHLRGTDMVGRYGGEEFAIVLPDIHIEKAHELIDKLRNDFSKINFHSKDREFNCTFSAGIACFSKYKSSDDLREAADQALYRAKRAGRNSVFMADNV